MNTKEADNVLLSVMPESEQEKYENLSNQLDNTPLKPLSADEIYSELAEARACYDRGEYEDLNDAINEISKKYGL